MPVTAPAHLLGSPHHDGSALYCPEPPQEHGDTFTVLLRVPANEQVGRVVARQVRDGEPSYAAARIDHQDEHETWWRADLVAHNTVTNYRFLTDAGPNRYRWHNATGHWDHDVPDHGDFRVAVAAVGGEPDWLADAVAYQVFPDRFARSSRNNSSLPDWAVQADWGDPPAYKGPLTPRQFFGGDLYGVAEHLDHIAALGANLVYLTPIFPAGSSHRYNAFDFSRVDPILGGDVAYRELLDQAHARGIRVIADLTTNHTGSEHPWFVAGRADESRPERDFYYFTEGGDYVGWLEHATLPKLNHGAPELRERLVTRPDSVVRRWLAFGQDGWRIDVANMTGRFGRADHNHEVARAIRAAVAEHAGAYLVGEHFHDFLPDLDGTTWHGVMNYAGFAKPIWTWLADPAPQFPQWLGIPVPGWPRLPGTATMATMREYSAVPWRAQLASFTLVGSHDTPRIRSIVAAPELVELAVGAMFTYPGLPMIWAGDEIGLTGASGEAGRRAFPWDQPAEWDHGTLAVYRAFSAVRRDSRALREGGLRWAYADADRLVWLREYRGERVLVLLARASGDPVVFSNSSLGIAEGVKARNLYGGASLRTQKGLAELPGEGPTVQVWRLTGDGPA